MQNILTKNKIEPNKAIQISAFRKDIRKTSPHKHHSYLEIIFLSSGKGHHYIDTHKYEIKEPVIFIVRKEQVHYWELDAEPTGYVLIIKKAYLDAVSDGEIKTLLNSLSNHSALQLKDNQNIENIFDLLLKEHLIESSHHAIITEGLLKALLAKIHENGKQFPEKRKRDSNLYYSFKELLSQDKSLKNNVAYYASKLNTSAQNLNNACRKFGDISATEVLSEFIISEGKRLLIYTDKTVQEISGILNFNDSSHFIKYFKKVMNCTPHAFRNNQ